MTKSLRLKACLGLAVGAGGLAGLMGFRSADDPLSWPEAPPPAGTTPIPVLSLSPTPLAVKEVKVCTADREPPRSYPVLSESCWRGDEHCTLFIAMPTHDYIRIQEYDAANPPVVVHSDDVCTRPAHKFFAWGE